MKTAEASVAAAAAIAASKKSKFDYTVVKTQREIELEVVLQAINDSGEWVVVAMMT